MRSGPHPHRRPPSRARRCGGAGPELRRARIKGGAAVDDRVDLFVLHLDQLGRVARGRARFRDDHRHRIPGVHRPLSREQRMRHVDGLLAAAARDFVRLDQRCDPVRLKLAMREHRDDPRRRRRIAGVDRDDPRVCMGRTHDVRVRLAGALDVTDEPAPSGEQGGVLAPRDAGADDGGGRGGRHDAALAGVFAGVLDGIDG